MTAVIDRFESALTRCPHPSPEMFGKTEWCHLCGAIRGHGQHSWRRPYWRARLYRAPLPERRTTSVSVTRRRSRPH